MLELATSSVRSEINEHDLEHDKEQDEHEDNSIIHRSLLSNVYRQGQDLLLHPVKKLKI